LFGAGIAWLAAYVWIGTVDWNALSLGVLVPMFRATLDSNLLSCLEHNETAEARRAASGDVWVLPAVLPRKMIYVPNMPSQGASRF
jgi:hypothetical protein